MTLTNEEIIALREFIKWHYIPADNAVLTRVVREIMTYPTNIAEKFAGRCGNPEFRPMSMCNHANEVPSSEICDCPPDCGCREFMCIKL